MAKERQKWTTEEEEALLAGVEKHGQGKWKVILTDPEFASFLANRSNIDLKDKWRNVSVNRDRVKTTPMLEGNFTEKRPLSPPQPLPFVPVIEYGDISAPSTTTVDRRTAPDYEAMVYEALCSNLDPSGLDPNSVIRSIEKKYKLPENFRRSVASKIRRMVLTGELVKVDSHVKIKGASYGTEISKQEDVVPTNDDDNIQEQKTPETSDSQIPTETIEDASSYAGNAVGKAETVYRKVLEACEEADRIGELVDESMRMLGLAKEFHQLCKEKGMIFVAP